MTDDQLLERLAAALTPVGSPSEPSPASLQNLHRAIDGARVRGVTVMRPRRGARALTIAVAAGVATVVLIAFVVASTSLRRIDGEVAVEVTTTVPSSELLEARARVDALEDALDRSDVPAVAAEIEKLRAALVRLSPSDRVIIGVDVAALLERADAFVEEHAEPETASTTTVSSTLTTVGPTLPATTAQSALAPTATNAATSGTSPGGANPTSPSTAPAVTGPNPTVDSDDNSGPGGGGSGQGGGEDESTADPDEDNSGPGGGGDSGSGGGDGS